MSIIHSDNATHRANLLSYEAARQAAYAADSSAAAIKAAELAFYRSARSSAIANNCSPSQFTVALVQLGTGGT
jgi:hypothetical protein